MNKYPVYIEKRKQKTKIPSKTATTNISSSIL